MKITITKRDNIVLPKEIKHTPYKEKIPKNITIGSYTFSFFGVKRLVIIKKWRNDTGFGAYVKWETKH